jgi:hypothetical protein
MRFGGIMLRLVVAAVGLVLIGGCSDPEPKEPRPTTSPTPTITVPTMPASARENSPEGAAAFVKHYIDVFNYASNTGDVTELSKLSDPKCDGCQNYIKLDRDTYRAGGYFRGGEWTPGPMHLDFGSPETYVTATIRSRQSRFRMTRGSAEKSSDETRTKLTYAVSRSDGSWIVTQLALGDAK